MTVSKYLKIRADVLILLILIVAFLSETGVISQAFGVPEAITLNSYGETYNEGAIIHDQDCYASKWVADHADRWKRLYAIGYASEVLMGEGLIPQSQINRYMIHVYEQYGRIEGYVYLRYQTIPNRTMTIFKPGGKTEKHSLDEYPNMLAKKNKIYTNRHAVVYF